MRKQSGAGFDDPIETKDSQIFKLYITGASPNSSRAISNLKILFEKYMKSKYDLQIIDVYQQPQVATSVDIIALPLLIRKLPLPERRLIGDMSNEEKVMNSLGLNVG
ncbi:MAG: circadian clock KaiB family protein [Chitinophagaceae bacterium]